MRTTALALILALTCGGCLVMSLHPFFSDTNAVYDKSLVGTWVNSSDESVLTFEQSGPAAYHATFLRKEITSPDGGKKEPGQPGEFEAHIGRINGLLFLDLYPDKNSWDRLKNEALAVHLAPTHTISRITITDDVLTVSGLDHDWLKALVAKNPKVIAHEEVEGAIVLTASTKALVGFLAKYGTNPKAFPAGDEFHRQK
jgi:hypothetical protein